MSKPKPRAKKRKCRRKLGSRSYRNYTPEMLQLAVESVANRTITSRDAEKQFGVPRRTIINKLKNRHQKPVGKPTRLSEEEEEKLINVIIASADFGSPLTKLDLRILVHNYLKKNGKEHIFNNKMPGEKWVNNLLSRHSEKLTVRSTQNISSSRAQKSEEEILIYFKNLQETLKDVPPANILNYDETNCSDNPGSSKAIFRRGVKYPERILNSTKGCVSLMFSGTADGKCLPPYIVYKADNLYNEWILNGPTDARYNCTRSGWFDAAMFEDYFRTVVLEWAKKLPGPKVVIGDNLSSHLSPEIVQLCEEYEIKFVFLPPNSTHLTQPLDIAFFGPLKKEWRKILLKYKTENPTQKTLNKKHFPALLRSLIENIEIRQSKNLRSGFKAAGIYPLNPREVLKRIPEFQFPDSTAYPIDESLLDYLKQSRAPNPIKTVRNKKVYIEPGKSVSVTDFETKELIQKPGQKKKTRKACEKTKPKLKKLKTDIPNHTTCDSEAQIRDTYIFNEDALDDITVYREETQNKIDTDKNPEMEKEVEQTIEQNILNEKTGIFQTFITTEVTIETTNPLKENVKQKPKFHKEFEPEKNANNESDTDAESKENIRNLIQTESTTYKAPNLKHKSRHNDKKYINKSITTFKRSKILPSNSSTTTEDMSMSVHSDSDLLEAIDFEESDVVSDESNEILELNIDSLQEIEENDEVIKKKNDEREAEIFKEIVRLENTDTEILETDDTDDKMTIDDQMNTKEYEHTQNVQRIKITDESLEKIEQHINNENQSKGLQNNFDANNLIIGDSVLVRYYQNKKWRYYIGIITEINQNVENKYKISYYKTISKKGDIIFKKPKRPDIDDITIELIIKQVDLLQINENMEFVLLDDEDSVYF